jgi:hypothetical protein
MFAYVLQFGVVCPPCPIRSLSDGMRDSVPFHFPFRPVDHRQWMCLRVEHPLVERDEVFVREQQEEIL